MGLEPGRTRIKGDCDAANHPIVETVRPHFLVYGVQPVGMFIKKSIRAGNRSARPDWPELGV